MAPDKRNSSAGFPQFQPSVPPSTQHRSLWDRTWKDKHGRYALWQRPNPWLIAWAVLTTLSLLFTARTADILSAAGSGALIIWALLEVFRGVNYFRRALGLLVLIFAAASLLKSL
jgi:hypothetical protein